MTAFEKAPEGQKEHFPEMDSGTWQEIKDVLVASKKEADLDNPKNCAVDEVKVSGTDTLQKMIDTTFLILGVDKHDFIAKKVIDALEKGGLKTAEFVKQAGADLWSVEGGKIILKKTEADRPEKVVGIVYMYPPKAYFSKSLAAVRRVDYKSGMGHTGEGKSKFGNEGNVGVDNEVFAAMGKEAKEKILAEYEARRKQVGVLEGQVDATKFKQEKRSEYWYKDKILQADALLKIYDADPSRFDPETMAWIRENRAILTDLANQQNIHEHLEEDYSSLTRTFEKEHTVEKVFGSMGVYNLLLAFERASNAHHLSAHSLDTLVNNKDIQINLKLGEKADDKEHRTGVSRKSKEDEFVPLETKWSAEKAVPPSLSPNVKLKEPYTPPPGKRAKDAE